MIERDPFRGCWGRPICRRGRCSLSSGLNLPMMSDPAPEQMMEQILRRVGDIPPLPVIATKILSMINDPDLDVDDLVSVIEKDQGLTARILRVSNSAFFGLSRKITTVKEAVGRLVSTTSETRSYAMRALSLEGRTEGHALRPASGTTRSVRPLR